MTTQPQSSSVAVIGAGVMGITLAYRLASKGYRVTVYELGSNPGGLASYMMYDGLRIDRFYHTILSSDMSMHSLIEEAGVDNVRHFTPTQQAFYDNATLYPFNTMRDLLTYPPLNLFQRIRLGMQIVYAQFQSDYKTIDRIEVEKWLTRVSGKQVYNKVWKPLLRAKFDTTFEDVPATYIWSRLRRMMGTRQGVTSKEMMCYLENGYYTLIEGLLAKLDELGVEVKLSTKVEKIIIEDNRVMGLDLGDGQIVNYDIVASTLPSPVLAQLIPDAPESFVNQLSKQEYLGVLCPLLILDHKLTPYYVINITDERIPFTGVVETTNLIDPVHVGGNHLVYLPRYLAPGSEMYQWTDDQVKEAWLGYLKQMFPDFDNNSIKAFIVQRARYVEPMRPINTLDQIPPIKTSVKNLYMGNTAMFYPDLSNGEAVTRFAEKILESIVADNQGAHL